MTNPQGGTLPHFIPGEPPKIRRTRLPREAAEVRLLIDAGELEVGDRLVWQHAGHDHVVFVLDSGYLEANGSAHASPTAAAAAVCTAKGGGWEVWVCDRDDETLAEKRRWVGDDPR